MNDLIGGRIRFFGASPVDLPQGLALHLRTLVQSIGLGEDEVTSSLAALIADVRAAVSSYVGLRLTVVLDGWPVTLTSFLTTDGPAPATSLRLTLFPLDAATDPESQLVIYASTLGALVDLAADYAYLHRQSEHRSSSLGPTGPASEGRDLSADGGHRPVTALDVDLPPITLVSGVTGLVEYTAINRAIGLLIGRGLRPEQAKATLHRDSEVSGLPVHVQAAQLLHG